MNSQLALLGLILTASCASVPKANIELDAQAKRFDAPPSGRSLIYVFRPSQMVGAAVALPVLIDGRTVGANGPGTYVMIVVAPGSVTVATQTGESLERVVIQTLADSTYFVHQQTRWGVGGARARLRVVDAREGRDGVLKARRADALSAPEH